VATTISFKFNEVACCIALHLMDPPFSSFSLASGISSRPAERGGAAEGRDDAARLGAPEWRPQREGEALAQVKKLGMKVNEIDTAPLVKAPSWPGRAGKEVRGGELLEQIQEKRADLRKIFAWIDAGPRRIRRRGGSSRRMCAWPAAGLHPSCSTRRSAGARSSDLRP